MAWSDLASNQWVSFNDAQTSPYSLKAGQSHVGSTQWMTKAEVIAKYNVNEGSFSAYASNQWVPKGAWSIGTVYQSAAYSESSTKNTCAAGGTGSSVTLTAQPGQFTSTVSQADADQQAINWVQTNKQANANTNGFCTWYNVTTSGTFTRTNCGADYAGGSSTYTVAAGTYSSTTSQAAANQLAQDDVNANGQNRVNGGSGGAGTATAGSCTIAAWYNVQKSGTFTRTNCGANSTGGQGTYTVTAGAYRSTISQADADAVAQSHVDTYGQNAVNGTPGGLGTATVGSCTANTLYYSIAVQQTFTRNNCGENYIGGEGTYYIDAGVYSSYISQADANQKAYDDIATWGQHRVNNVNIGGNGYVNNAGSCTIICNSYYWDVVINEQDFNNSDNGIFTIAYRDNTGTQQYSYIYTPGFYPNYICSLDPYIVGVEYSFGGNPNQPPNSYAYKTANTCCTGNAT